MPNLYLCANGSRRRELDANDMNTKKYLKKLSEVTLPIQSAFSDSEYKSRLKNLRAGMESSGVDLILITTPPNICYLTGYDTFGVGRFTCLVIPLKGELEIILPTIEACHAYITAQIAHISDYNVYETREIISRLLKAIERNDSKVTRIGLETQRAHLSPSLYDELKSALPNCEVCDVSDLVSSLRLVKSPAELEYMRKAAVLTQGGIEASIRTIVPGCLDNEIAAAGYAAMIREGGDFFSAQPILAVGYRSGLNHSTFKRVPLQLGDTVIMEYGACYNRYTLPTMRTAILGKPDLSIKQLEGTVLDVLNQLIESIKPGRTFDEVAREAKRALASIRGDAFFHGIFGYSVGLGFPPTWDEGLAFIAEGVETFFVPGMTLHLPIAIRIPGLCGVAISETIVVTQDGCDLLSLGKNRQLIVLDEVNKTK